MNPGQEQHAALSSMDRFVLVCVYICMYVCVYIYIYIYIYRERERLIKMYKWPHVLTRRADVLLKLGRPRAAINDCDAALDINPDNAKAYNIDITD